MHVLVDSILSDKAVEKCIEYGMTVGPYGHKPEPDFHIREKDYGIANSKYVDNFYGKPNGNRDNPIVVRVVEELGPQEASGFCADLKVVEIPDGVEFEVEEYDGNEWVAEKHRTWPNRD